MRGGVGSVLMRLIANSGMCTSSGQIWRVPGGALRDGLTTIPPSSQPVSPVDRFGQDDVGEGSDPGYQRAADDII